MSSATGNRPSVAMTNSSRSIRFPEFGAATGKYNSDDRSSQPSTSGQTFGNGGTWQPSSGIWGNNTIGSGFSSTKRDPSRSRVGNDEFLDGPSGSGALAASSEADPWAARANGPWNPPDTTSPTLTHSGSTSPSHTRNSIPNTASQTLIEIQQYQQSRPAIGQGAGLNRSQPKSSLDPSSGSFFTRKPSSIMFEDKENLQQYHSNGELYEAEIPSKYLGIGTSASRDSSMPPSRVSDSSHNGNSLGYGGSNIPFSSMSHTPNSSMHSHRPSFSTGQGPYPSQTNGSRYDHNLNEIDLSEKFANFGLGREVEHGSSALVHNSYSPTNTNFAQNYQPNGPTLWNDGPKSFSNYEAYLNQPFTDQGYFTKAPQFRERGSVSPAGSDCRRGLHSPKYYSGAGTPPATSDQVYRPSSRGPRIPQGPGEVNQRLQNIHFAQQAYMYSNFQRQYPQAYDYPPQFRQGYGYPMPMPPYPSTQVVPTRPAKDQDIGVGVRSVLLEEFRSNSKSNKRYELKDIYNHVVEFSGDQHGSRFIQQKLETANSDEKEQLFREIQPNALQLMTDVFGNYVIQKLFEHGNQVQKRVLAEQMKNHVLELSMQMYGCRVVQKALEHVLTDQQAELVKELKPEVLKCVKDQNGNHVVQRAIERVPTEHIQFVIEAFRGQVHVLATHPYGCRVIQRILEYCRPHDQAPILEELHQCASMLVTDQYGNYVTQHIISHGKPEDQSKIIKIVQAQLLTLSKHKFASNVVEKSIVFGTNEQRQSIVAQIIPVHGDGTSPLQLMMKDQYGNYVIQKLLKQLEGDEHDAFVEIVKNQLVQLKKFNCGKQVAAMEKVLFGSEVPTYDAPPPSAAAPRTETMPIETNSSAATPMLTNGQNSPQSSSLPSTNVSTIDDPSDNTSTRKAATNISEKSLPHVVINGA